MPSQSNASIATASSLPNVLVIMSSQHAPSVVGALGHPCVKTPHMDALAARGTAFTRAYCPYPMCTPSRAGFMTGLLAPQHNVWELGSPLSPGIPTWTHALRRAGYVTSIAGRMHFLGEEQHHGYERRVWPDRTVISDYTCGGTRVPLRMVRGGRTRRVLIRLIRLCFMIWKRTHTSGTIWVVTRLIKV